MSNNLLESQKASEKGISRAGRDTLVTAGAGVAAPPGRALAPLPIVHILFDVTLGTQSNLEEQRWDIKHSCPYTDSS